MSVLSSFSTIWLLSRLERVLHIDSDLTSFARQIAKKLNLEQFNYSIKL